MKYRLFTLICFFSGIILVMAQSDAKKFSVGLGYPVSIGDDLFQEIYSGTISGHFAYNFAETGSVHFLASLNGSFLSGSTLIDGTITPFFEANTIILQPRISASLYSSVLPRWHPSFGLGYTAQFVSYELRLGREDEGHDTSETYGGINFNAGLQFDISRSLFINTQYDYTALSNDGGSEDFSKNIETITLFKVGLGYRF